jgi:hypothetical protein
MELPETAIVKSGKTDEFWFEYEGSFYDLPKDYTGYFAVNEQTLLVFSKGKVIKEHHYPI